MKRNSPKKTRLQTVNTVKTSQIYTHPQSIIASAALRKPAILEPSTRLPASPNSLLVSVAKLKDMIYDAVQPMIDLFKAPCGHARILHHLKAACAHAACVCRLCRSEVKILLREYEIYRIKRAWHICPLSHEAAAVSVERLYYRLDAARFALHAETLRRTARPTRRFCPLCTRSRLRILRSV